MGGVPVHRHTTVSAYDVINTELAVEAVHPDLTLPTGRPSTRSRWSDGRPYPYLRATLLAIICCLLDYADAEFSRRHRRVDRPRPRPVPAPPGLLGHPRLHPYPAVQPGRAGAADPAAADRCCTTRVADPARQAAAGPQHRRPARGPRAVSTGDPISQPTPYRFKVLLARAQQLTQQAAQLEAEYLSALEKYDDKTLQLERRRNTAASIAAAQLSVHDAQVQRPATPSTAPPSPADQGHDA